MEWLVETANENYVARRRRAFDRADVEDEGAAEDGRGRRRSSMWQRSRLWSPAAAVTVLVGGLLVEGGDGDGGDSDFDAAAFPVGVLVGGLLVEG